MDTTACDLFQRCVTRRHNDDWHEFTRRYGRRIRSLVWHALVRYQVTRAAQELEEYMQELYLRLLVIDSSSFRGRTELELWQFLARLAQNLVVDRCRVVAAERRGLEALYGGGEAHPPRGGLAAAPEASPERRAIDRQLLGLFFARCRRAAGDGIQAALKMRIMHLAFFDGCSSREIARKLRGRTTARQVDALIFRLRRRLARQGLEVARRRGAAVFLPT